MAIWLVGNRSDVELELRTYARPRARQAKSQHSKPNTLKQKTQHITNTQHNTKRKKKATAQRTAQSNDATQGNNCAKIENTDKEQEDQETKHKKIKYK